MCRGYEFVDCDFVFIEERMDVVLVQLPGSLGLRCDQPQEEECADPGIEWNPAKMIFSTYNIRMETTTDMTYQTRMNSVHDSTSRAHASTTQYMSHGVRRAGSEVLRAL